ALERRDAGAGPVGGHGAGPGAAPAVEHRAVGLAGGGGVVGFLGGDAQPVKGAGVLEGEVEAAARAGGAGQQRARVGGAAGEREGDALGGLEEGEGAKGGQRSEGGEGGERALGGGAGLGDGGGVGVAVQPEEAA